MRELEFLKSKGLIKEGFTEFVITGDFGKVELTELLKEYKTEQLRLHGIYPTTKCFNQLDELFDKFVSNVDTRTAPALHKHFVMPRFFTRILYRLLKKDMVNKLSKKHGEQFIDDVMQTFGMPTNLMDKYYR
jgi:hypothetical protein